MRLKRLEFLRMPFKGVVLGASVYGDMTARTAGDLDVLIYYRDLQASHAHSEGARVRANDKGPGRRLTRSGKLLRIPF